MSAALAALLLGPAVSRADETCMSPYMPKITGQEDYVYVWTVGIDCLGDGSDKLVTVGARPGSPTYGKVVSSVSVGGRHEAHHAGFTDDRRHLWAGGLDTSMIWVFDVATDPAHPKIVKTISTFVADSGGVVGTHTFFALPGRMLITSLSNATDLGGKTALVEYDNDGGFFLICPYDTPVADFVIRDNISVNDRTRTFQICSGEIDNGQIYNNTISGCQSVAIVAFSGTVTVQNNAILNSNAGRTQTAMSGTITSDHNAFSGTWGGTCTTCVSDLTSAAFTNVGTQNFALPPASVLIDKGTTIASFSNDHLNILRPQGPAWDVGAYEFSTGAQIPSPPQNPRLQ